MSRYGIIADVTVNLLTCTTCLRGIRLMERFYDGEDTRVIDVFHKWIRLYSEDFTEENFLLFNMFLSDLDSKGKLTIH